MEMYISRNKFFSLLTIVLLLPLFAVAAPTSLSIEDFEIKAGETKNMFIDLTNPEDEITLVQFDLRLPDGLSIAKEDGDFVIDIAGRTTWKKHSLYANALGDVTRFLLVSNTNAAISGNEGAIISIKLVAAGSYTDYDISLENILLVTPQQKEIKPTIPTRIIVPEAGTLSNYISDVQKYTITALKINGCLNSTDFKFLRDMAGNNYLGNETEGKLQYLDLSGVNIVTGGEYYLETDEIYYDQSLGVFISGNPLAIENDNELGKDVFMGCRLKELILPTNLTSIAEGALGYCFQLTNVVLPEGVLSIGESAFQNCESLQEINVPSSVTSIGRYAFAWCGSLSSINLPDGITKLEDALFYGCESLTSITIPVSVTSIGSQAFGDCKNLLSITIPSGVTEIASMAFDGCRSLTSVSVCFRTPISIYNVFSNRENATLYVPKGCKSVFAASSYWQGFKEIVEMEGLSDLQGDANGDGNVTITDAVAIVNKILGNESAGFNEAAADVSGDGKITITDAVGVVNIILNNGAAAPAMDALQPQEPEAVPE